MKKSISSINNIENFVFNTVSTEYNKLIENFVKTLHKKNITQKYCKKFEFIFKYKLKSRNLFYNKFENKSNGEL